MINVNFYNLLAVIIGAAFGATSRWIFSMLFNPLSSILPLGTLFCNILGCYLIGFLGMYFSQNVQISENYRLLLITGLLGSLTTFSTFSYEVFQFLHFGFYLRAMLLMFVHLFGGIIACFVGVFAYKALFMQ